MAIPPEDPAAVLEQFIHDGERILPPLHHGALMSMQSQTFPQR